MEPILSLAPVAHREPAGPDWIWDGYLASGHLSLLTGPPQVGKTTLLAVLLARMATGGDFLGRRLRAGRAFVLSDEPVIIWGQRHAQLNLGSHVRLICQP